VGKSSKQFFCYVLYSKSIDRYYIGYTSDPEERLRLHNSGYFGRKSYTHRTSDWEMFLLIPCQTVHQAVFIESRIKKMKSRQYIKNLKRHPNLIEGILKDFNN
jgi:putative endonuclease